MKTNSLSEPPFLGGFFIMCGVYEWLKVVEYCQLADICSKLAGLMGKLAELTPKFLELWLRIFELAASIPRPV